MTQESRFHIDNKILCATLVVYNICFMSYNEHFRKSNIAPLLRTISILFLFLMLCIVFLNYFGKYRLVFNVKTPIFKCVTFLIIIGIYVLSISIVKQVKSNRLDLVSHTLKYICFYWIPIILCFLWISSESKLNQIRTINTIFYAAIIYFFIFNTSNLRLSSFINISWNDSYSSVFESDNAHLFLFLLVFYLYIKDKRKSVICVILCMLSFKRISFILAPFFFFTARFYSDKKVNRKIVNSIIILLCVVPAVLDAISNSTFVALFDKATGIDLNLITSGRMGSILILKPHKSEFAGMGSIASFIENNTNLYISRIGYLHCDLLVWMWECGIFSVVLLLVGIGRLAKINYYTFALTGYLFLLMATTHFLDMHLYMSIFYFVIFYIFNDYYETKGNGYDKD